MRKKEKTEEPLPTPHTLREISVNPSERSLIKICKVSARPLLHLFVWIPSSKCFESINLFPWGARGKKTNGIKI